MRGGIRERQKERERKKDRERERDRQTDRDRDRLSKRVIDRARERQLSWESFRERGVVGAEGKTIAKKLVSLNMGTGLRWRVHLYTLV